MTFKSSSLVFFITVIICGCGHFWAGWSLWWLVLPFLLFNAALVYGSAMIQSNFYTKAHCEGTTTKNEIALTFDDGPNAKHTPEILNILKEYSANATFFVIGKNIAGNENLLKQIDNEGHFIGNHTYSHSFFIDFKSKKGFNDELNQTLEAVFKCTGRQMKLFRPPYGVTTPNLANASRDLNYEIIGWNVRSLDTTKDSEEIVAKRVKEQLKPGAIVLFHDTSEKTAAVLKQTLNFAKENGFKIVSVEQLLNIKAYEI